MQNPILFLVFNRPGTTASVFETIRQAKPPRLYVVADGPREHVPNEALLCSETRRIATAVDWEGELKTLFRDENLGCKGSVSGAITWFFEHEEQGIILEDDVLPSPSFFPFCDFALENHKNDKDVMMVCGYNPFGANVKSDEYFFSLVSHVWGWATWRECWNLYDLRLKDWPQDKALKAYKDKIPPFAMTYYADSFDLVKEGWVDTWDYQWTYTLLKHSGKSIKPFANLISNIGAEGTHASQQDANHFTEYGMMDPKNLKPNKVFEINAKADDLFYQKKIKPELLKIYIRKVIVALGLYRAFKKLRKNISLLK